MQKALYEEISFLDLSYKMQFFGLNPIKGNGAFSTDVLQLLQTNLCGKLQPSYVLCVGVAVPRGSIDIVRMRRHRQYFIIKRLGYNNLL